MFNHTAKKSTTIAAPSATEVAQGNLKQKSLFYYMRTRAPDNSDLFVAKRVVVNVDDAGPS